MTGRKLKTRESKVIDEPPVELLPSCRIKCQPGCFKIGNQEYQSASEALDAYLNQFDSQFSITSHYTAYNSSSELGTSLSRLHKQKLINDEIQKAKQDLKIQLLKKALDKSEKLEHSHLQKEVNDALMKSGELLEKLNTTDDSVLQCASDIGSLTTDVLLTINPYQSLKQSESKHVYSYHRRPQSRSIDTSINTDQNKPGSQLESSSIDQNIPLTGISLNKSKVVLDNQHLKKNIRQLRSRSVSPTSVKNNFITPSWVQELDSSSTNGPPSWIDGLAPSDISDSIWAEKQSNQKVHSRLNDDKLMTLKEESFYNSNPPRLYSNSSKSNPSFSELRLYTAKVISDADKFLKETDLSTKTTDSDISLGFNQDYITMPKPKIMHTTLDRYIADISSPFSGKKDSESLENMPRCSSMDSMMGEISAPKSDITGASTIPIMASNTVTPKKSGRPTVTFSPQAFNKSCNSSFILDGDRPWEHPPTQLKPPIYVDETRSVTMPNKLKTSTLSGGQQPGSMEALKKMLFKLQTEDMSTESKPFTSESETNPAECLDMPALKDYNFKSEPGGHSLEKALVHLSRLKNLVERKQSLPEESALNKSYHSAPSSPRR